MQKVETKSEIIRIGTEMIARNGFNTTGLDQVLKKAKVPKGSFYYYFASKEDFGLAVIERFASELFDTLDSFLNDKSMPPLERVRRYLRASLDTVGTQGCKKGCLIGNLSQEMASQHEKFRRRLEEIFSVWREKFETVLEEAKRAGELSAQADVKLLSDFLLTGWQGAVLRSKVVKSIQPIEDFLKVFFEKVLK